MGSSLIDVCLLRFRCELLPDGWIMIADYAVAEVLKRGVVSLM